jgi:tetratricopeptide (TPR) repeat protein
MIALKQLAIWLKGESPVIICQDASAEGYGGVGKSLLAAEFAHRYGQYFSGGVFWMNFAIPELISSEIAASGDLADDISIETRVKQVLSEWLGEKPRLLIFDGCEDPHLLEQWLPPVGGSRVLVTSRQCSWDSIPGVEQLPLGPLERSESITVLHGLRENLDEENPDLNSIAEELEDFPLALHLAGCFLDAYHQEMSPGQYLNSLQHSRPIKNRPFSEREFIPSRHDLDVGSTMAISLQKLGQENEFGNVALDLLKRIACFAPGELIPRELLMEAAGVNKIDTHVFEIEINLLQRIGLLEENSNGDIRIHKLVASFIRELNLDKAAQTQIGKAVCAAAVDANLSGFLSRMWPIAAHVMFVTDQADKRQEQTAKLANEIGYFFEEIKDHPTACRYYEKSLLINRKILGEEHPGTARSYNNLGGLQESMGDYPRAKTNFEHALAIRRKVLGEEHPDTARSFNNLGFLLQQMGDYPDARTNFMLALAYRKKVLGEEHPDTIHSLNCLGGLLQGMNEYSGAKLYYEKALAIRRKVLGEEDPDTATSLSNLGAVLQSLGEYQDARKVYKQALAIDKKIFGKEHPRTAASLNNLGVLLRTMGDYTNARNYLEQALEIRGKVLGLDHPDTAVSLNDMGELLQAIGDYPGAQRYYEQALAIRKKVLDGTHPQVAISLNNLGNLSQVMGDSTLAHAYFDQALSISNNVPSATNNNHSERRNFLVEIPVSKVVLATVIILSISFLGWQVFGQGLFSTPSNRRPTANFPNGNHIATITAASFPTIMPRTTRDVPPTSTVIVLVSTKTPTQVVRKGGIIFYKTPTPRDMPHATFTPTSTSTRTYTPTQTPSQTSTYTPSNTPTWTYTPSITPSITPTYTFTFTPSNTPTASNTFTLTFTPSNTPTRTFTITPSFTPSNTLPPTHTYTPTDIPPTSTDTPVPPTDTPVPSPTDTP